VVPSSEVDHVEQQGTLCNFQQPLMFFAGFVAFFCKFIHVGPLINIDSLATLTVYNHQLILASVNVVLCH